VIAFHIVAFALLVRAFAPDLPMRAMRQAAAVLVTVTTQEEPLPTTSPAPDAGSSAPEGKKASPRPAAAPKQPIPVKPTQAPPVAATGTQDRSGANAAGQGPGGGGEGVGTGSGNSGSGQGNGIATKAVLVSGVISAAKDFPIPPGGRESRVGRAVIVALTVDIDGVPSGCRVYRSSGLPETDQRTCELALQRLRFRPAMDALGRPVISTFYWQQRFFE
jgi:protein TonB